MKRTFQPEEWGSFDPIAVHKLGQLFDEVWASLAPEILKCCDDIAMARDHLASLLVELAKDSQLDSSQITRTTTRVMRERYIRCL
jgi:hypothetical protein